MQIHGGDIYTREYRIDFSANINPLGTPKRVLEAACAGVGHAADYPDVECRALREAISRREAVPREWILCGNGAAELIFALALAIRPRKALLVSPGFAEYEQALLAAGCGCEIRFYKCRKEQGFQPGEDYLEQITDDLDLVFLCNPNNPTGLLLPEELMERIILRCREKKVLLAVDECFNGLLMQGEQVSLIKKLGEMPNLFLLKAFTKLYAMAGLRLGYGLCSDTELLLRLKQVLQPWNVSIPAQMAGIAAMEEVDFAKESCVYVSGEREFLKQGLKKQGIHFYDSQANYLFFEGPSDLYERCASEGILIRDCSNYRGLGPGYFRIAVKKRAENEELLRVLARVWTEKEERE